MTADLYAILGLDPGASHADIRAAYRRLAWRLHPDRNTAEDALARFQQINEAYATLANADARAAYDRVRASSGPLGAAAAPRAQPICCTECGRPTAQPRILVFRTVRSFLLWSSFDKVEGIFCVRCARRAALEASVVCATRGWWAPLGPVLTAAAIAVNAAGGGRRPLSDQKLLLMNARAFLADDRASLAYALARKVSRSAGPVLAIEARSLMSQLRSGGVPERTPRLKDPWRPSPPHILAHALLFLTGPAAAVAAILLWRWSVGAPGLGG